MSVNLKNNWQGNFSFFPDFSSSREFFNRKYFFSKEDSEKLNLNKNFDFEGWKNKSVFFEDISWEYLKIIDCEEKIVKFALETSNNLVSLEKTEDLLKKNPNFLENLRKKEFLKESKFLKLKKKQKNLKVKEKFWEDIENALKIKENIFKNTYSSEVIQESKEKFSDSLLKIENFDYLNFDLQEKKTYLKKTKNDFEFYVSDVLYERPKKLEILFEVSDIFEPFIFEKNKKIVFFKKMPDLSEEFLEINKKINETIDLYFSRETFEGEFKKTKR